VGGRTAELVVASRLSRDPALHVLVLEASEDLPQLPEKLMQTVLTPAGYFQLQKTSIDWTSRLSLK
jgi:choline dehydrogenase-like flavoprotein